MALGNVSLSHKLKTASQGASQTHSAWTCEFLSSYVAPDGRKGIQWLMPGGDVKRFKNSELKKSEPKSLKDEWSAVKGKTAGDYVFISQAGLRFEYKEGQLRELSTPDGKTFDFKTDGPRITSIRQEGSEVFLLNASYTDLGQLSELMINQLRWRFMYQPITGQLSKLFVATSEKPISFVYQKGLLTQIVYPDNTKENFTWRTDFKDYEKESGLKLPEEPPPALLAADDHFRYYWGISQQGIHLVAIDPSDKRQETILNPRTNELIQIDRNDGELMYFYALERENGSGKLKEVRAPDGRKMVENRYDKNDNLIYQKQAGKPAQVFNYDTQNRLLSQGRTDQEQILYAYTEDAPKPSLIRNVLGHQVKIAYDDNQRIVAFQDLNGGAHRFAYDKLGRLVGRQYPLGFQERWSYNPYGNLIEHVDMEGASQRFHYDEHGRLVGVKDGDDIFQRSYNEIGGLSEVHRGNQLIHKLEQHVTAGGRVVKSQDEMGRQVEKEFDSMGKLLRSENELGEEISYKYNRSGDLLGWTDERGVKATLLRDQGGRVGGILNDLGQQDIRKYNKAGLLRSRKTGEQQITFTYDREGRVIKKDYGDGQIVTNTFDKADRLTKSIAGEMTTLYQYDALDRIAFIKEQLSGGIEMSLGYTYTPGGQKASVRLLKTQLGRTLTDVTTSYTYDLLGRVTGGYVNGEKRIIYGYSSSKLNVTNKWYANGIRHAYIYDDEGRPAKVTAYREDELVRGIAYQWNVQGQLTQKEIFTGEGN